MNESEKIHAKQETELLEELERGKIKIKTKIQIKTPIPELIPRLIPLEYCNLTRAAKMLEIEVDDIRHFNQVGKIELYRRIEEKEMNEGEVWSDEYEDYIPCNLIAYKLIPYFVDEVPSDENIDLKNEVYIKYAGLEAIHNAIYGDKPLSKLPEPKQALKPAKIFVAPVSFIAALLELLPDLKEKLDKASSLKKQEIVDHYFKMNGKTSVKIGINNYENWMAKSTYVNTDKKIS